MIKWLFIFVEYLYTSSKITFDKDLWYFCEWIFVSIDWLIILDKFNIRSMIKSNFVNDYNKEVLSNMRRIKNRNR